PDLGGARDWLLGGVVLMALAVALAVALSLRRAVGRSGARLASAPPARAAAVEMFAQAASLAARGEFREAARVQYLATMLRGEEIPSMHTSGPAGARALALWLADLGYVVRSTEYRPFALAPADRVLLQLDPTEGPSEAAVDAIVSWVERGGTLVLTAPVASP